MESWIRAAKNCYSVKDGGSTDKSLDKLSFVFLGFEEKKAELVFTGDDCAAYSWVSEGEDYFFAIGKGEKSSVYELQDRLEEVFDRLLGEEGNSVLYAARYVVVDDMQGIEVCGETLIDGADTVFYGLYLSDDKEGYYFTGFGTAEAEFVFDELTGAARHFYRKPQPSTILKGKSADSFFISLRSLAAEVLPDKFVEWNIFNATFLVENGKYNPTPSIIVLNEGRAIAYKLEEIYDGKDFSEAVSSFIEKLPSPYDISGFTITNFKDGRYGVTYYPVEDDYEEEESAEENHGEFEMPENKILRKYGRGPQNVIENGQSDYDDLDDVLDELSTYIASYFPDDWQCGMGLVTAYDEAPVLTSFHSGCGRYMKVSIPKTSEEEISEKLGRLGEALENHYPGWNAFAFSFVMGENAAPDLKSIRDEAFNFDVFIDAENKDDFYEEDEYLLPIADYFEEEFKDENLCVAYVTFKVAVGEDGLFVVEPATAGTDKGVIRVKSFNNYLPKISSMAEDIFEDYEECNTISVTIFPERKFGFYLEYTEAPSSINRRNISSVLKDKGLSKYESSLLPLIRDELTAIIYEVEVESSLAPGSSKIGGSPDMPKNSAYPVTQSGAPFEFIAQIDLEEIAPFDKTDILPYKGLLSFFFDRSSGDCKVFFFKDDNLEMVGMPEIKGYEAMEEYLPSRLRFIPSVSLPILGKDISEGFFEDAKDEENYADISDIDGTVKIFGYSDSYKEKDVEREYIKPLKLLLQVPSVPECDMEWGPAGGTLYFWIEEDDLKLLNFDKCFCVLENYEDI